MVVTTSGGRLFISFGHSFEIFSCEGLIRSVDALYLGATTRKTKKIIFLSTKYRFTVIPGQSDRKKTKVDLFRKLDEEESECQYRKQKQHSAIFSVQFTPEDFTRKYSFKEQSLPIAVKT